MMTGRARGLSGLAGKTSRYKPLRRWGVMCGDGLLPMAYDTRKEARGALDMCRRLRQIRPENYPDGAIRVVRLTVQIEEALT